MFHIFDRELLILFRLSYNSSRKYNGSGIVITVNVTATTDLQKSTIAEAKKKAKHNKHEKNVNHANVQIDSVDTGLNQHIVFANRDELLKQQFQDELNRRNKNVIDKFNQGKLSHKQYEDRIKTLDDYLNHTGKKAKACLTNVVLTLGNVDTTRVLLDQLGFKYQERKTPDGNTRPYLTEPQQRKEWSKLWTKTYEDVAKWYQRKSGFGVSQMWMHCDEGGAPHAHMELVNMGRTKTDKASYNINNAIKDFDLSIKVQNGKKLKLGNNQINLKTFRNYADTCIINSFNSVVKSMGYDIQVKGIRTGAKGGLSMSDYKKKQAQIAVAQKTQEALKTSYKEITGKEPKDDKGEDMTPSAMSEGLSNYMNGVTRRKNDAEKKASDADQRVKDIQLQEQEAIQKQQEAQVKLNQLNQSVKDKQDEEKKLNDRIKQRRQQRLRAVQKELDENNIQVNGQPATANDSSVESWEKWLDKWRDKKRKTFNKEKVNSELVEKAKDYDKAIDIVNTSEHENQPEAFSKNDFGINKTRLSSWVKTQFGIRKSMHAIQKEWQHAFTSLYGVAFHGINNLNERLKHFSSEFAMAPVREMKRLFMQQNGYDWEKENTNKVKRRQQQNQNSNDDELER